jgi:ABC-type multidrug transport system ATPase subunit
MNAKDLQVKVHHLSKSYDIHKKAVSDLTFGLSPGECFALLGVTGAGKTTTFKCITGEEIPD